MIRVAIADDQVIVLTGLQRILLTSADIEVTGLYKNGEELLEALKADQPDVLLLDIQMPGLSGIELAGIISKQYPAVKIIAITNVDVIPQVKKMLAQGSMGYLLKDASAEIILQAVETVAKGGQYLHEPIRSLLLKSFSDSSTKQVITKREKEILGYIVEGFTNKEIADKLFLSLRTVENHRNNLLQKFNAKNTAGLVKLAIEEGLV